MASLLRVILAGVFLLLLTAEHALCFSFATTSQSYSKKPFNAKSTSPASTTSIGAQSKTSTDMLSSLKLSPTVESMALSKTIEIHALTKELEASGQEVFSLCVGEPDYQPPPEVFEATIEAVTMGATKYTGVAGDVALRAAIAEDLFIRKQTAYTADEIVVANGAKQAVFQALVALVAPGEEVIIPAPYWTSYPDMVKLCYGVPLIVPTTAADEYVLSAAALRSALQQHPAATCLILCNPSNPTGSVASAVAQEELAAVLRDYPRVSVISDEIYEQLVYDGVQHVSFAAIKGMMQRTVTINGFSKSHSMTGYRIGYAAAPLRISKAISKVQSQLTSCASSISQFAACKALQRMPQQNPNWMRDRVAELQRKRDIAFELLQQIPGVYCPKPTGAFYLLPDVSSYYGKSVFYSDDAAATFTTDGTNRISSSTEQQQVVISDSLSLCKELLRQQGVALVPGSAFGVDECIRISYAADESLIREAISRLGTFLTSLK